MSGEVESAVEAGAEAGPPKLAGSCAAPDDAAGGDVGDTTGSPSDVGASARMAFNRRRLMNLPL